MKGLKKYLGVSIKGACMGAADVIPGVSGGTIAFITGIYDEFVGSIASINMEAVRLLLKGRLKLCHDHCCYNSENKQNDKQLCKYIFSPRYMPKSDL